MRFLPLLVLLLLHGQPSAAAKTGCKAFRSCDGAQRAFKAGDQSLDRDDDGIPCENLCKDPTSKEKAK
jgi:hypothetical protein